MKRLLSLNKSAGKRNWYLYILLCSDKTYYTGVTNNLPARTAKHNSGKGAKYTRVRRPVSIIYFDGPFTKVRAMRKEYAVKQLSRIEKEELVKSNPAAGIVLPEMKKKLTAPKKEKKKAPKRS